MTVLNNEQRVRYLFSNPYWKRIIDRFLALVMVVVLSPSLALIAIMIRLDSPGRAVFTQERVGENGRRFNIHKFRTMHVNGDDSQYKEYVSRLITEDVPYTVDHQGKALYKIPDDQRVTRFGAFLRRTNLDELPQLFNVVKGEMSLVGPRPDIPFAVEMYRDWHRKRLSVTPGMTGLWQVSGLNRLSFEEMVKLDIEYADSRSLLLDCKILFRTIGVVLGRDGSYRGGKEVYRG